MIWESVRLYYHQIDLVSQNWDNLKERIFYNGVVTIRGYGRDAKGTRMYY